MQDHQDDWPGELADIDREYDNVRKVEDHVIAQYRRAWRDSSQRTRAALRCLENVRYGPEERNVYDLFLPPGDKPCPVVVYVHGGYWRSGDKSEASYVADAFVAAGYVCAVINYGLAPQTTVERQISDCRQALLHIASRYVGHGAERNPLHLIGHSAGAHLVAMLLHAPDGAPGGSVASRCACRSAALVSGIYDLRPIYRSFLNQVLQLPRQDIGAMSPAFLPVDPDIRSLVMVGGKEGPEYLRQSTLYVEKAVQGGAQSELLVFDDDDHFSIRTPNARTPAPALARALTFFQEAEGIENKSVAGFRRSGQDDRTAQPRTLDNG